MQRVLCLFVAASEGADVVISDSCLCAVEIKATVRPRVSLSCRCYCPCLRPCFFSLPGQGGGSPRCPCRIPATTAGPSGVGQGTRQGLLLLAPLEAFAPRCQKGRRGLCRHAYFRVCFFFFYFGFWQLTTSPGEMLQARRHACSA